MESSHVIILSMINLRSNVEIMAGSKRPMYPARSVRRARAFLRQCARNAVRHCCSLKRSKSKNAGCLIDVFEMSCLMTISTSITRNISIGSKTRKTDTYRVPEVCRPRVSPSPRMCFVSSAEIWGHTSQCRSNSRSLATCPRTYRPSSKPPARIASCCNCLTE